ncbi:MAG TPA: hypothetical protein VIK86_06390 [Candidatus Paceibacterota bacterium]
MKIKQIVYNWFQCGSIQDKDGAGEDWSRITVGDEVIEIIEHMAQGEGDKTYYLIKYKDGRALAIFNPNTVEYINLD